MKILIVTGIYPPDIGGPAVYTQTIAREFSKKGHSVAVVTFAEKESDDKSETNPSIKRVSRRQNKFFRFGKYFWLLFKEVKKADKIYVQGSVSAGFPAAVACWLRGKKFVLKIVGDVAWERSKTKDNIEEFQNKKYNLKIEILRQVQKWVCRRATKIIVPSEYLKKIVVGWGVEKEKITVIYNAFTGRSCESYPQANHQNEQKTILSVGRLVPWKGFEKLIGVMIDLPADTKLKIVGDGPDEKKLKNKAKELNLKNRVEFLGKLEHDQVLSEMNQADVFVLNTEYEGLPHVLLEALGYGLPVVATRIGGNPEVIEDGWNGTLVETNNKEQLKKAIRELLDNEELRKKYQENGQRILAEKFSEQVMTEATLNID